MNATFPTKEVCIKPGVVHAPCTWLSLLRPGIAIQANVAVLVRSRRQPSRARAVRESAAVRRWRLGPPQTTPCSRRLPETHLQDHVGPPLRRSSPKTGAQVSVRRVLDATRAAISGLSPGR